MQSPTPHALTVPAYPPAEAQHADAEVAARRLRWGLWLGLLGVICFAITVPATRLATGTAAAPQMSPEFVTLGRLALAGLLSAAFLGFTRSPWPPRSAWKLLGLAILGSAIGFPLLLALALRHVSAGHAAVVLGSLPLVTAVMSAVVLGQRARPAFWVCACFGATLVMAYMGWQANEAGKLGGASNTVWLANALLLGTVVSAALGYVCGAKLTPVLGAERVICWMCVACLPVALPLAWHWWPQTPISTSAWAGLSYAGTVSMWAGFFAWYRGLDWGGVLRVSQIQLLQPFFSMLAAWPLLGEVPEAQSLLFALAVMGVVVTAQSFARAKLSPLPLR